LTRTRGATEEGKKTQTGKRGRPIDQLRRSMRGGRRECPSKDKKGQKGMEPLTE